MSIDAITELELDRVEAIKVLCELYNLLEDYGPTWYSEGLHNRAEAALRALREASTEA